MYTKPFLLLTSLAATTIFAWPQSGHSYNGPILASTRLETVYSEHGKIKWRLVTQQSLQYENGDKEFLEGIYIEFLEDGTDISWAGSAQEGHFSAEKNLYMFTGNVELKNFTEPKKLNTETLYWDPEKKEIYTDTAFKVEAEDGKILTGQSFTAQQDFSHYHIVKPQGSLPSKPIK